MQDPPAHSSNISTKVKQIWWVTPKQLKNLHGLTGLPAESRVLVADFSKWLLEFMFHRKNPTVYVFFGAICDRMKKTYNAGVLANVGEFFHHLVLQDQSESPASDLSGALSNEQ